MKQSSYSFPIGMRSPDYRWYSMLSVLVLVVASGRRCIYVWFMDCMRLPSGSMTGVFFLHCVITLI